MAFEGRYQTEKETRSGQLTIDLQREDIEDYLIESPSLRPDLPLLMEKAYKRARAKAAVETGLDSAAFPESCEWTLLEVLR